MVGVSVEASVTEQMIGQTCTNSCRHHARICHRADKWVWGLHGHGPCLHGHGSCHHGLSNHLETAETQLEEKNPEYLDPVLHLQ